MKVLIPSPLLSYTKMRELELAVDSLQALFAELERCFPGIRFRVVDEQGRLRANMRLFVNGLGVRDLQHALRPDDEVAVVHGDVAERRFVALYGRGGRLVGALGWNRPRHVMQWRLRLGEGMDWADALELARSEP